MVFGCGDAPSSVSRFAEKVDTSALSGVNAADAKLSIECRPGIGPSASTPVLM
jgi:hypothetical protein